MDIETKSGRVQKLTSLDEKVGHGSKKINWYFTRSSDWWHSEIVNLSFNASL